MCNELEVGKGNIAKLNIKSWPSPIVQTGVHVRDFGLGGSLNSKGRRFLFLLNWNYTTTSHVARELQRNNKSSTELEGLQFGWLSKLWSLFGSLL